MEGNFNAMTLIRKVAGKLKDEKLANIKAVEMEIGQLDQYLGLTDMQTVLFVAIFDRHCSNRTSDVEDISDYFNISAIEVLERKKDIDRLVEAGFVCKDGFGVNEFTRTAFKVDSSVFECILDSRPVESAAASGHAFDRFDMVRIAGTLVEQRRRNEMSTRTLFNTLESIENEYGSMDFIRDIRENVTEPGARILFYDCCHDFMEDDDHRPLTDMNATLKDIYDKTGDTMAVKKSLMSGEHILMKAGLIESWLDGNDYKIGLTDEGRAVFLREDLHRVEPEKEGLDRDGLVKAVCKYINERDSSNYPTRKLFRNIASVEKSNCRLPLVGAVQGKLPDIKDRTIFYAICKGVTDGYSELDSIIDDIFDDERTKAVEKQMFKNEQHLLQKLELVELGQASFFGGVPAELTETGKELFLGEDMELFIENRDMKGMISPENIKEKHLFFAPDIESRLSFLKTSLQKENYEDLKSRLSSKALPSGVAALFYGGPGTGKTESVYQIAKAVDRGVMQVDISEMKTCWYGESQKLVRRVFKTYARMCRSSKNALILLCNEGDAIFGKRMESPGQSVDQTENAIQNIILEEMEKLDGILIATTNLATNLDPAFERRFLFKIKFEKPEMQAKMRIWKDKLPEITDMQAMELARDFDFSGGEIDNIARKAVMQEILGGSMPDMDHLRTLCAEERLADRTGRRKIGYNV